MQITFKDHKIADNIIKDKFREDFDKNSSEIKVAKSESQNVQTARSIYYSLIKKYSNKLSDIKYSIIQNKSNHK